jgi:predicted Zn-dependent protease
MKRALTELVIIVFLFFFTWFAFNRIDWISVLKVEKTTKSTEEKLGNLYWQLFSRTEKEVHSQAILKAVDSLVVHICKKNSIDHTKIKLHILQKQEVNAFTLPDNYLVVYTGLLNATENEAELLGVLSHEIAHMEKNHVMKKLMKEVGLSVLISMTTGRSGGEIIKSSAKLLSSSAYDRNLEREADQTGVGYLINADIDPEPLANFLYRLSDGGEDLPDQMYWLNTHPDSKERAEWIIAHIRDKTITKKPVLSLVGWQKLKERISELE